MKKGTMWLIIILVVVIVGAGIWWYSSMMNEGSGYGTGPATYVPTSTTQTNTTTTSSNNGGASSVLSLATSATLGSYLTATNGMTLYKYTKDTPNSGSSTCTGQCAAIWPPYTVSDASMVTGMSLAGATGTFGTITRADGSIQVTYNGSPLYFYSKDVNPGDVNGQGVGGIWFVMAP